MLFTKPLKPNTLCSQLKPSNNRMNVMNHLPKEEAIKGAFFGALVGDALRPTPGLMPLSIMCDYVRLTGTCGLGGLGTP